MSPKKAYRPYISLFILLALVLAYYAIIIYILTRYKRFNPDRNWNAIKQLSIQGGIVAITITGEAIVYILLAKRIVRKLWVRMHLFFLYFALVIVPLFFAGYIFFFGVTHRAGGYSTNDLFRIRQVALVSLLIIAHIFFIGVIIQAINNKNKQLPGNETPDLLDEFAE